MTTRTKLVATVLLATGCASQPDVAALFDGRAGSWIDLSYSFSDETIYWPTAEPFALEVVSYDVTPGGYFYAANNFSAAEHGGTHLDAPIHFSAGQWTSDEIPLDRLMGPAVVLTVNSGSDPDYLVTVGDLEEWEANHGPIPSGAIVLLNTGWGSRYGDRLAYLGTDLSGPEAVPQLHFPGLHPDAARWLVEQRSIDAVGIDTPSIDYGQSSLFETHQTLFGANIPAFENVANLGQVPPRGAFALALPMKIAGGSGGPLRIIAFVPD